MRSHRRSSRAYNHKCFIIIRNLMNTLKFQFDQVGIYICLFFIYQTFRCDQIGIFQLARSRIVLSSFQSWPFLPDGTTDTFYESFIVIASEGCPKKRSRSSDRHMSVAEFVSEFRWKKWWSFKTREIILDYPK
jgi:hypothetical protein